MIRYQLQCEAHHKFEGWFSNSADYDSQADKGLLECPVCASRKIEKALMAPALAKSTALSMSSAKEEKLASIHQDITEAVQKAKTYVEKNFDNVGKDFPEEARKIHYGEAKKRGIYGQAKAKEVRELIDEGIEVAPLPEVTKTPEEAKKKLN